MLKDFSCRPNGFPESSNNHRVVTGLLAGVRRIGRPDEVNRPAFFASMGTRSRTADFLQPFLSVASASVGPSSGSRSLSPML